MAISQSGSTIGVVGLGRFVHRIDIGQEAGLATKEFYRVKDDLEAEEFPGPRRTAGLLLAFW
jgi:hypothetical protein